MAFMIPTLSTLIQALLAFLISNHNILSAPGVTLRSLPIINSFLRPSTKSMAAETVYTLTKNFAFAAQKFPMNFKYHVIQ